MNETNYDVIIIGGGFAGVTAARDLTQRGRTVLLLEARNRLGGRTWYEKNRIRGFDVEMGGGWLGDDEKYAMAEVRRYNVQLHRDTDTPSRLVWRSANGIRESILPIPFEQLPDVERALGRLTTAASRIDPAAPWDSRKIQELSDLDIPLPELFDDLHLPTETLGVLAGFWSGITSATWDNMSALLAARLIAASGGTFMDYMGTVMLGPRFEHGTIDLLSSIIDASTAAIVLNAPVTTVRTVDGMVQVLTDSDDFSARAVVCTAPLNTLGDITFDPPLSHTKQQAIAQGQPGMGYKLWMVARHVSGGLFSMGHPGPFNHLFTLDERDDEALVLGFGRDECPDLDDLEHITAMLREYVPEAEVIAAAAHDWRTDPYSKGTWAVYPAGFISAFELELRRPEGPIHLAGGDISEQRPGYIDGAIESGITVANKVESFLTGIATPSH
jgi:monoamine oxidase